MMNYLPYKKARYKTALSNKEVRDRMANEIKEETGRESGERNDLAHWSGTMTAEGFKVERVINYRNSFLPILEGRIAPQGQGTILKVTLRLAHVVLLFSVLWVGVLSLTVLGLLIRSIYEEWNLDASFLLLFGMIVFGYSLVMTAYNYEAKKYLEILVELLELEEIESENSKTKPGIKKRRKWTGRRKKKENRGKGRGL